MRENLILCEASATRESENLPKMTSLLVQNFLLLLLLQLIRETHEEQRFDHFPWLNPAINFTIMFIVDFVLYHFN